ncbi:MAG: hypothetical protein RL660_2831 [Bacteroidota bacterium]|jgi:uncharacterized membrane protein YphA (DoxX/SURF4 family)
MSVTNELQAGNDGANALSANRKTIAWVLRILIAVLFIVSALSKAFQHWKDIPALQTSVWGFEKQLVELGFVDWCSSPYLARFIIGLELAIGIALLFNYWIRRLVIPGTILLLLAFIVHLCIQGAANGFTNGNCGCFGSLLPMTPLEAIIKNIITIALLVVLWFNVRETHKANNKIMYPLAIWFLCEWLVFMLAPFCPCKKKLPAPPVQITESTLGTTGGDSTSTIDTTGQVPKVDTPKAKDSTAPIAAPKDTTKKVKAAAKTPSTAAKAATGIFASVPDSKAPAAVPSKFAEFHGKFTGGNVNTASGKKIVCMFAPGCEHCQACCKDLCKLKSSNPDFPEVVILFMDEETEKIPEFFKTAGCTFPYQVLDIGTFWSTLGNGNTPNINAMWNGNIIKSWEGTNEHEYKSGDLLNVWK